MKRKLRAAYFAGSMKPGQDGVTRVLYRLIDTIKNEEIDSIFFSPIIPPPNEQQVKMIEVPGVTIPLYKEYKFARLGYKYFEKQLKEFNPDIIHINSPCSLGCAAIKYANKNHTPVVATYHTHFPSYAKYYKVNMLEPCSWNYIRSLYSKCDSVFVPSIPIMNELKEHGLNNVEYLPHGIDLDIFNPNYKRREWKENIAKDKTVILYAGRLVWEKDLLTLAGAYKIVMQKRGNAKFVLAGDGPVKGELQKLMPEAEFLGYQSGIELSTAFASSDIFAFPSTTETFGIVTLEAMASKLPPVCAGEGGAYGIIQDGITGLITEPRNEIDLAEKIIFLIDNPGKREAMAEKAYEYAEDQTWEKIFKKLFTRYEEIIYNYHITRAA